MIKQNLKNLTEQIDLHARKHKRDPEAITLVAVSKMQAPSKIQEALDTGQRIFGENRVQEAHDHWERQKTNYKDLRLHLIGPLQTNKVKEAVALFDVIETLDREKLAVKLDQEEKKQSKKLEYFIQVNTGEEEQKSGVLPHDLEGFLDFCRNETDLAVTGLMCIPPLSDPATLHFAFLANLAERHQLNKLSMGMSADFEKAITFGATHLRLGTAIFGERTQ